MADITLDQLAGVSMGGTLDESELKEVDITEFNKPVEPESSATNIIEKEAYDDIAPGIERYTREFHEQILDLKEKQEKEGKDEITFEDVEENIKSGRSDNKDNEEQKTKPIVEEKEVISNSEDDDFDDVVISDESEEDVDISSSGIDIDDDDFKDLEEIENESEPVNEDGLTKEEEKIYDDYKESIRKNINIINSDDMIDLSTFSKGSAISSVRAIDKTSSAVKVIADHVMYSTGKCISMEALDSDEIVQFNPSIMKNIFQNASYNIRRGSDSNTEETVATMNSFRQYNRLFQCIYKHVTDKDKGDYNSWLKGINWADLEDLMFLAYKATYGVISNKITVNCSNEKCNHLFIQEANIVDMVKFGNNKAEERFKEIMQLPEGTKLPQKIIEKQVSRDYIFTFKAPSLYTMVVEATGLTVKMLTKYSNLFSIYQYIDKIEFIDREAMCRREVTFPKHADINKTVKSKLKIISDILKTLTLDQRQAVLATTVDLDRASTDVTYVMPETKCEKCGTIIEETPMSCADLLFTRFQLIAHLS